MRLRNGLVLGAALIAAWPAAAAQDDDELEPISREVVQPLPNQGGAQLNVALTRLAANPRDVSALLDAGNAALLLGDTEAALGFFGRAEQIAPADPRSKAALARALVWNEDPFAALPLFEAAERAGAIDPRLAGDRGLAYDLLGDNSEAQRHYRQALAALPGDEEIARRLALSLAIAGDRKGSDVALLKQLQSNTPSAWRTRAFALAILGDTDEAVRIAQGTMPPDLSEGVIPYLRYMGRLTPAQQAAAANFGHFPRAAQIGRDDPRVARYAALNPRKPVPAPVAVAAKSDTSARRSKDRRDSGRRRGDDGRSALAQAASSKSAAKPASASTSAPALASTPTAAPPAPTTRPASPPVRVAAATPNPAVLARSQPPAQPVVTSSAAAMGPAFTSLARPPATAPTPAAAAPASQAPAPRPGPAPAQVASLELPPVSTSAGPAPVQAAPASTSAPAAPAYSLPQSNLDLARRAQQSEPLVPSGPPPQPATETKRDLASAFGDFRPPDEERASEVDFAAIERERARRAAAAAKPDERGPPPEAPKGIRRVASADPAISTAPPKGAGKTAKDAAKDKNAKSAKPEPPKHPSRIWVQIGVGRDKGALGADWRKYLRTEAELFKGRKAWTTPWGQTNRLLVGPFDTQAAAQAFLKEAKKQKLDAFVWSSPAGQAIDALVAK